MAPIIFNEVSALSLTKLVRERGLRPGHAVRPRQEECEGPGGADGHERHPSGRILEDQPDQRKFLIEASADAQHGDLQQPVLVLGSDIGGRPRPQLEKEPD